MSNNEEDARLIVSKIFNRFESLVTLGIIVLISIMIIVAFWGLMIETYNLVRHGEFDHFDHKAFQSAFGMIMTVLIAIELSHTIMYTHLKAGRDVIVKTVLLVAILAVSRQFIVFELETVTTLTLLALAVSLLSLGVVYWLMGRTPSPNYKNLSKN